MAELDQRLIQLTGDVEREQRLAADAEAALERFTTEETSLRADLQASMEKRTGANELVTSADTMLAQAEQSFGTLTGTLAELTARRSQLEAAVRTHGERLAKIDSEIASVSAELHQLSDNDNGTVDLAALSSIVDQAQSAVADAEAAALRAEVTHSSARQALDMARKPLAEAERRAQRLDTEAETLAKLLHVETKNLWPAVIDQLRVQKGYEAALGAALGDDLEAPVEPSAPMRWAGADIDPGDPALPGNALPLSQFVNAPHELARRLAQIGVIERENAPSLTPLLRPGQRLVSREGDLWRWDGFAVAANAPTGAARRLAGKNRLADIEAELQAVRGEVERKRDAAEAAEAEVAAT